MRILIIFSVLCVMGMPTFLEFAHHHDGPEAHEATCSGDCGCVCHIRTFTVTTTDALCPPADISLILDSYLFSPVKTDPASVDHPPELLL